MKNQSILIVDDVAANRKLLATIIKNNTRYNILLAKSGKDAINSFNREKKHHPDLILLDIMMPEMNGYQAAEILKTNVESKNIPIIFITAMSEVEDKIKAFKTGGVDYISKPFNKYELLARINVHLQLKNANDELTENNRLLKDNEIHLEHLVAQKTRQIAGMTISMVSALENANLYNDEDTGLHIKRVGEYSALLAKERGMDFDFIKKIRLYAPLHDVGKVGIPDKILKKQGKYSVEEFDLMKKHVIIGGNMLDDKNFDPMAKNIALYHHEKWDGAGYSKGLTGSDIPIEARITALADVYDALTTKRSYKEAFSDEKADTIIKEGSGRHFDPDLVSAFFNIKEQILSIKKSLQ
jgi:putative two-component system response regulator